MTISVHKIQAFFNISLFVLLPLPLVAGTLGSNEIEGIAFKSCSDKGIYEVSAEVDGRVRESRWTSSV